MQAFVLFLLFGCVWLMDGKPAEPVCSRFAYEEETLYKMVRLEFEVEQMVKETKAVLATVQTELAAVKLENSELWTEVQGLRNNMTKDIGVTPTVLFLAKGPTDNTPATNQVIIYGTIVQNVGGGYDAATGKFTASVKGVYTFSMHACAYGTAQFGYSIRHDDAELVKGLLWEEKGTGYPCTSVTAYTQMDVGDKVWVTVWNGGSNQQIHTTNRNMWNSFSGLLIHT